MTVRTGELRHRVTIQENTPARDSLGQAVSSWTDLEKRWAQVLPLAGRELEIARQVNAQISHQITMRHGSSVTAEHRIKYGSRTFNVNSVVTEGERDRRTVCMCTEIL